MNKEQLSKLIGNTSMTIVDAMKKIDENARGILFIVNKEELLIGCVTDGDIRRWILKSGDLGAAVDKAMVQGPYFLFAEQKCSAEKVMKEKGITALPIVDGTKTIQEIIFLSDYFGIKKDKKKDLSMVPVIIMAGGKGTRLYPYTKVLPKPLIPIGETPIIERIINCFTEYNISTYYMTVNYKKSMIKSYFADISPEYDLKYIEEEKPLGTCGSIKLIKEKFDNSVFVTNCDALILTDYADLYNYHEKTGNDITVVSALKNVIVPYGVLHTGENGEIISMEEKPHLSYLINTGMYIIRPEVINSNFPHQKLLRNLEK